jgi:hypothetical protein
MSKNNGKTAKVPYSYEAFVKNWQKSSNIAEVVAATGLSRNTVSAMSTRLRKEGVKLKMMPRRTARPIDVNVLNKIVKEATPQSRA